MRSERMFLALCVALPDTGARTLAAIDPDELFTTERLRRAARHLATHIRLPLADLPSADEDFVRLVASLVELAGRIPDPTLDRLEHSRLVLERDRLERAILDARGQGRGLQQLPRERECVRAAIREIGARIEGIGRPWTR